MQHATVSTGAEQDVGKNQSLVMGARAGVLLFCPAGNRIAEPCENCRHGEIFVGTAGNARCRQDAAGGRPACFSRLGLRNQFHSPARADVVPARQRVRPGWQV